uniref:N-acetyl-gamma-glutamyl-phosphate reductase n=1 Tax=uncultured Acidobacteriota bacterium TaxID=171953 RepID=G8DPL7_9BACT|nr:N-acetyl-gamma-glutamyl-phosphate reductase [uncultured Acidobacteriota bacterium]
MNNYKVGVVGFRGYSGAELVGLLTRHPQVEPILLEHRQDSDPQPQPIGARQPVSVQCSPEAVKNEHLAVVFLATPADVSMELAPQMLDAGAKVIDLSGAFRLRDSGTYSRWYKEKHSAPELLSEAVYGLPEFCRERIAQAHLIANPGCYPTAANLAIQPLIASGVIDRGAGVVCDAKSGVSGAGRKPRLKTSFGEVIDNFSAYSVFDHRHVPEILMESAIEEAELSFTAQLIPIHRGILETIYFRSRSLSSAEALLDLYKRRYQDEPFVRLYPLGTLPDIRGVDRTNFCDIGVRFDPATGRAVVVSAIDNLVKGAAGQAMQNMNLVLNFPETEGLL